MADERSSICKRETYQENIGKYLKKAEAYTKLIDELIRKKPVSAIADIIHIFQEPEVLTGHLYVLPEFCYSQIIEIITVDEVKKNGMASLFMQGNSLDELIRIIKQIEFRLWALEFVCGEDASDRLFMYLTKHQITLEALRTIIFVGGMEKQRCYLALACMYLEHGMAEQAVQLMEYGIEDYPMDRNLKDAYVQLR